MAWTTPRTWNIGELVTKAIMDTHIRDNLNYLKSQVDALLVKEVYHTAALGNTSWDGDAKNIGTYTITANSFNATIPAEATAVLVSISVVWAAASNGSYCGVKMNGASGNGMLVRAQVANFSQDNYGWVGLDGSGRFSVTVAGANATGAVIEIWGWRL